MPKKRSEKSFDRPVYLAILHLFFFAGLIALIYVKPFDKKTFLFVGVGYFIIAYFIFLFCTKKMNLSNEFKKEALEVFMISFVAVLFLFGGSIAGESAEKIELTLPFKDYLFEVKFSPFDNVALNPLHYFYDFQKQEGEIYFKINKIDSSVDINNFTVEIPAKLKIRDFELIKDSRKLAEDKDFKKSVRTVKNESYTLFHDFKKDLDNIFVKFSIAGNLIPNGRFRFFTFAKYANAPLRRIASLYLGDYHCQDPCFGELIDAHPEVDNKVITIKYPKGFAKPLEQVVNIHTYLGPLQTKKEKLQYLQLALVVSGLVLIGEMIRRFIILLHTP